MKSGAFFEQDIFYRFYVKNPIFSEKFRKRGVREVILGKKTGQKQEKNAEKPV